MKGWLASMRIRRARGRQGEQRSSTGLAEDGGALPATAGGVRNSDSNGSLTETSWRPDNNFRTGVRAVLQPQLVHGAAGDGGESKVSFFRRTLSTLSRRSSKGTSAGHAVVACAPSATETGPVRPPSLPRESNPAAAATVAGTSNSEEGEAIAHADTGSSKPLHWPHLTVANALLGEGEIKRGVALHASHLPFNLPHLSIAHALDGKGPGTAATNDIFQDGRHSEEVMAQLQDAAQRALKIIEAAKSERETLMQRARQEAQEEARALRANMEQEGLQHQRSQSLDIEAMEDAATLEEQQVRNLALERIDDCVQMCVAHVLNVDIALSPEKSATLRNIKENPPAFFLKSHAGEFPSVRNHAVSHRTGFVRRPSGLATQTWDDDEEYFGQDLWSDPCDISNKDVYATILGERSFSAGDGDEFRIDFGELDNPSALGRVRRAISATCGCIPG